MLDLEEKIVDHAARQVDTARAQQAANDEVAVPAVHLVEAAARHNIFIRKIKQTVGLDLAGVDLAQAMNRSRQMLNAYVAVDCQLVDCCRLGNLCRQIKHGRHLDLGIDDACAFGHRASQRVPRGRNVTENRFESLACWNARGGGSGLRNCQRAAGREQKEMAKNKKKKTARVISLNTHGV